VAQDSRVLFVPETDNLETAWKSLTPARLPTTNVWTDAYLAALAGFHGLTVVSFDRSFPKRDGVDCLLLPTGVIH
jgi:predicted nucleic acid-binding protein